MNINHITALVALVAMLIAPIYAEAQQISSYYVLENGQLNKVDNAPAKAISQKWTFVDSRRDKHGNMHLFTYKTAKEAVDALNSKRKQSRKINFALTGEKKDDWEGYVAPVAVSDLINLSTLGPVGETLVRNSANNWRSLVVEAIVEHSPYLHFAKSNYTYAGIVSNLVKVTNSSGKPQDFDEVINSFNGDFATIFEVAQYTHNSVKELSDLVATNQSVEKIGQKLELTTSTLSATEKMELPVFYRDFATVMLIGIRSNDWDFSNSRKWHRLRGISPPGLVCWEIGSDWKNKILEPSKDKRPPTYRFGQVSYNSTSLGTYAPPKTVRYTVYSGYNSLISINGSTGGSRVVVETGTFQISPGQVSPIFWGPVDGKIVFEVID